MKIVIQRVSQANVKVDGKVVSEIGKGMMLLVCMEKQDDSKVVEEASRKVLNYRIFADENGKMNLNLEQVGGEILAVSQFTLSWNGKKGNRPSFDNSKEPNEALVLFDKFCNYLSASAKVEKGQFGEHMNVSLTNDGPVTFSVDF
ncbi:D-aminoacyl-tRNA deacylase [Bacteriovorax sp. Seq25_V]|uniref:D-aminoacyl-tRNA deacylase n=1 Tax=Bacteriovorax sp. Seq25_V TaxID=1201288 RepID=UPI00038A12D5|nr:D-aminoacyl-tRNA deacylase [Bacteriovorax sp. Seq25_V]EQC43796.1 D-tyrosyl-tRNA(Tyr) deacylase [Bacteriovorax sp. Seq25_V]